MATTRRAREVRRHHDRGAATTTAGAATATTAAAAAATKAPLKLGWVGTVSGPAAPTGQQTQGAVKAWEQSVNARGGINGHPVKVSYEDDAGDPARGLAAVKKLVEEVGVVALVGNHPNTTETAFADYITQHKVPVVGGESDTPVWLQNPYFFVSGEPRVATLDTEAYVTKSVGETNFGSINEGNVQDVGPLITLLEQATQKVRAEVRLPHHGAILRAELHGKVSRRPTGRGRSDRAATLRRTPVSGSSPIARGRTSRRATSSHRARSRLTL